MATIIYFSHGGGPLPILGDPSHNEMISFMKKLPEELEKPEIIIVISAHWEEEIPSIIGSGFSFNNMKAFDWAGKNKTDEKNNGFQDCLIEVCTGDYSQKEREDKLQNWEKVPNARYCHPREEHLIPLHVCCGVAGGKGKLIFDNYILGKRALAIRW